MFQARNLLKILQQRLERNKDENCISGNYSNNFRAWFIFIWMFYLYIFLDNWPKN